MVMANAHTIPWPEHSTQASTLLPPVYHRTKYLIQNVTCNTLLPMTLPLHLHQRESHDCGVASVAMAADMAYADAKKAFEALGLHVKKPGRPAYSSNFKNVQDALDHLGCSTKMRKFTSWDAIEGPTIVKVDNGHARNWHWVYATRSPTLGLIILDPGLSEAYIETPPPGVFSVPLLYFHPKGNKLVVTRPPVRQMTLSRLQTVLGSIPKSPTCALASMEV